MRHRPKREKGNCAGIGFRQSGANDPTVKDGDNDRLAGFSKPRDGLIVYLRIANSAERRAFRRFLAQLDNGITEKPVEWIHGANGRQPFALQITASVETLERLISWINSADNRIVARFHAIMAVPTFTRGVGESGERSIGASGSKAMKRHFLKRSEREARYFRDDKPAMAKWQKSADNWLDLR